MPRNVDNFSRPAPESEDDLEVPGQPFLGLLGILSEYYKYREPHHKQGKALGDALRYLYRVKKRVENGMIDENFGMEIMNAVNEVMATPSSKPKKEAEKPAASETPSSSQQSPKHSIQSDDFGLDDFGFYSSSSSEDEISSKIDSLVKMVKSTVKKKKKKKHKPELMEATTSELSDDMMSIPKLKIKFGTKQSCSDDPGSSGTEDLNKSATPMKLKIKLGTPVSNPPLLPPPPLLTLHKPTAAHMSPSTQPPSLSPKYEPEVNTPPRLPPELTQPASNSPSVHSDTKPGIKLKLHCDKVIDQESSPSGDRHYPCGDKPPIKLTLRVQQPMRKSKGWISPRTEQMVNYIDDVTTFVNESKVMSVSSTPDTTSPVPSPPPPEQPETKPEIRTPRHRPIKKSPLTTTPTIPEPPKLKLAPSSVPCRKRKRESSPVHSTPKLTAKAIIEDNNTPVIPPLKLAKTCTSKNLKLKLKEKKGTKLRADNEKNWDCGIFSNTLKQNDNTNVKNEELDFRSNILPIYCGINYLKKKFDYTLPYDIWRLRVEGTIPDRVEPPKQPLSTLKRMLKDNQVDLPKLSECEYVFDQHLDNVKPKGRKRGKKKVTATATTPTPTKAATIRQRITTSSTISTPTNSPCESPELVIQSDCESPLPLPDPLQRYNDQYSHEAPLSQSEASEQSACSSATKEREKLGEKHSSGESASPENLPNEEDAELSGLSEGEIEEGGKQDIRQIDADDCDTPHVTNQTDLNLSDQNNPVDSNENKISEVPPKKDSYNDLEVHLQDQEICTNNIHDKSHPDSDSEISFEEDNKLLNHQQQSQKPIQL